ncbi:MAG: DUF1559 domain-containing protein [Planctomycetia bacterium]|nr:DUF1559 domain-containing protein [Planctomycetia bacterium]
MVELLTVISIIGMLTALLVPAVQAAREAGRQVVCKNNLHQVALACDLYHTTLSVYPPGQFTGPNGKGPYGNGPDSTAWSFLARLLPYLERQDIYEAGDIPNKTLIESGVAHLTLGVLHCPSSGPNVALADRGNLQFFPVGPTNYKGVSGSNWGIDTSLGPFPIPMNTQWPNTGANGSQDGLDDGDGMFFRSDERVRRTAAHILDGLSNTFMLGEDLPEENIFCSWPYSNNAYGTCAIPPNFLSPGGPGDYPNRFGFRSNHPHGLNFAFAGGSVRRVGLNIDLKLYRSLATIHGSEGTSLDE